MDRTRIVWLTMTSLVLCALAAGVVLFLVRDDSFDPISVSPEIVLPVVPSYRPIVDYNARTLPIGIDQKGVTSIRGVPLSSEDLRLVLERRLERYGLFPVIIGADFRADFDDVWQIVQTCGDLGFWRSNFLVAGEQGNRHLWCVSFAQRSKMPLLPDAEIDLILHIAADTFVLNGKELTFLELHKQIERLSTYTLSVSVHITTSRGLRHGIVAQTISLFDQAGFSCVTLEMKVEKDGAVTQESAISAAP